MGHNPLVPSGTILHQPTNHNTPTKMPIPSKAANIDVKIAAQKKEEKNTQHPIAMMKPLNHITNTDNLLLEHRRQSTLTLPPAEPLSSFPKALRIFFLPKPGGGGDINTIQRRVSAKEIARS